MPYPQIGGRIGHAAAQNVTRPVLVAFGILAVIFIVLAWRFVPRLGVVAPTLQSEPATKQVQSNTIVEEERLRLNHAEQQLAIAAEQLVTARRLLASLGPSLSRNYLGVERRRVDAIWVQCDTAHRAIEEARTNITAVSTRKEN